MPSLQLNCVYLCCSTLPKAEIKEVHLNQCQSTRLLMFIDSPRTQNRALAYRLNFFNRLSRIRGEYEKISRSYPYFISNAGKPWLQR